MRWKPLIYVRDPATLRFELTVRQGDFGFDTAGTPVSDGLCASVRPMADDSSDDGLRRRLARSGEDALGKLAQDLLENPLVNGALSRAFEAREKAAQAQEVAMG